jgi:gliding motility-associated-like protein
MNLKNKFFQLAIAVLSALSAYAQPANDGCAGAISLGTLPTPGACTSGLQNGAPTTLNNQTTVGATAASPYVYQTQCTGGGNMQTFALDTWYSFTASGTTGNINISGFPNANVAVYSGSCGNLLGRGCLILPAGGAGTLVVTQLTVGQTYYIQVSGNTTTATDASFSIAVDNDIDCNDCLLNSSITASPAPVNGGYQPGQTVQFCYTVNGWSQQNTNWFHGVQISMGPGWTGTITGAIPAATEQNIAGPGFDGAWYFYPSGIGGGYGTGFYFETVANGTDPGGNFGDNCDGNACSWTFCWTQTVSNSCTPGTSLSVTVNTSGDGESGSWTSSACTDDAATNFSAIQICCTAPTMASTPQTCIGVNNGTATATHGTGASPWDYSWTGPGGFTASTMNSTAASNTISNLAPGTYIVTITDNNNCVSSNTVVVGPGINCQCLINNFTASIGSCQPNNTFPVSGTFVYSNAPATGTLVVEVTTASGTYTQTFNPPFVNGQTYNYNITNAISDGSASTVEVYFTADLACTQIMNFTAPAACLCAAEIGTFTADIIGVSNNNYVLCYGDVIDIQTNNDWIAPGIANNPPGPTYSPGVSWLIFSCPPTVGLVPSATQDVANDPCLQGIMSDFDLNDLNDLAIINSFPAGTFTNNTVYYVPITMYSIPTGTYSYVNTSIPCYELGTPYAVQYLPQITNTLAQTCTTVTATISGGLPALNGSQFTTVAGSLTPANATFGNTSCANGGTITINGLTAGQTYSFQVQDANGCPKTITGTFTGPPILTYPQAAYCKNGTNPSPTITGTAGGTYTASPAGLSINASTGVINLAASTAGTYTVTYTTPAVPGPACPATYVITVNPVPVIVVPAATMCLGTSATLNASGANTYSWTPSATLSAGTGASVTATPAATTTYTISGTTTATGCIGTTTAIVTVNPLPTVTANSPTVCAGGSVTLTGGGASTYSWTGGVTNGVAFVPPATGTYTVTGTSAAGCINTAISTVTVNPLPTVVANDVSVCAGGTVTVSATGANTYSWSPATSLSATTGANVTFTAGATTSYTVTGTSAAGCISTDPVTVTVLANAPINAGPDVAICIGASTTLTATGGVTYTWNNGLGTGNNFSVSPAITTTYTVVGTDATGCTGTDAITVTVNPLPIVNAGADQTVCAGTAVTLTASGAATYSWNNGVTNGVAFTPAATTTYTVTGTSAAGCIATDQVVVTVNPLPIVNAGTDQTICIGASVTLTGSGASTYTWNNGVTNGVAFAPTTTTTYTVTGTTAAGCIATDQVVVTVNPLPIVNAGTDQTVCVGASVTLTGTGATTYTWSPVITNGVAFTPAATATYTLTGTDANGCINTDQVLVTVNPLPVVNAGTDQTVCIGASVTLNATGAATYSWSPVITNGVAFTPAATTTYTVTGTSAVGCISTDAVLVTVNPLPVVNAGADQTVCAGTAVTLTATGATSYTWTGGVANGVSFTPAATATYTVTGTNANGCINTDAVTVTVNPLPIVNAGTDQTVCNGATVTLTATGATTYTWTPVITNGVAFTPTLGSTTYSVTGTTAAGCTGTDQVVVTVNPNPAPVIQGPTTYCTGNFAVLSTTATFAGYNWSTGSTNPTINATQANNPITVTVTNTFGCQGTSPAYTVTENNVITANFTVTICQGQSSVIHGISQTVAGVYSQTYVSATGCDSIANVTLVVNPLPAVNAGPDQSVCTGVATTLTATGASTYTWSPVVTNGVPFTQAIGTTTYTVTGTSSAGCVNTDQVNITVNPLPIINAGPDQEVCIGGTVTLTATGGTSYTWNNGITNGVAFTPSVTTTYTVTGTDANGCTSTDQAVVTVNPLPLVNAGPDQTICIGATVTLSGSGAANYTWNNGVVNGVAFAPTSTATYTVTGTDLKGCINTDQVVVTVNPLPLVNAGPDQAICIGASATLAGSGASSYTWTAPVVNNVAFSPTTTNTYTVTGTSAQGCINTDQVVVTVNPLPTVGAGPDQAVCAGTAVTLSGSGASTYTWNNSVTNGVAFTPAVTNTYTVTGTDVNGCINTDQVVVTVNPIPTVGAGADVTICIGAPVTLSGSGAATYTWNNGITNGVVFNPTATATYTVSGTSAAGCVSTDQVVVTVNPLPVVNAGVDQTVCIGTAVTLSGSGAATYSWSPVITNGVPFTPSIGTVTYTVTGTSAAGCISTDQMVVTVNPLPIVNAGIDQAVCAGEQVTLTASGAATYSWNNGVVNGVAFTPAATTTYTVTGTSAEGCINTDQVVVTVNPIPNVFAGNDISVCDGQTVTLTGSGANIYTWDNSVTNGVAFTPAVGSTTYTVSGTTTAGCINTDQIDITVVQATPVSFTPNITSGCAPLTVTFTNTTANASNFVWTMSDGTIISGTNVATNTFEVAGCYDISLSITNEAGCFSSFSAPQLICVEETPVAAFSQSSFIVSEFDPTVEFYNESIGASTYNWTFGDETASTQVNPMHDFSTATIGSYLITLIATSPLGCADTAYSTVQMQEELIYYVPNTFTPDNDNFNQTFKPIFTSGYDPFDYTLLIFNRWGEIVFESHNSEIGWDGSYGENGEISMVQDGVFTWKIEFKLKINDERRTIVGHVNLLR